MNATHRPYFHLQSACNYNTSFLVLLSIKNKGILREFRSLNTSGEEDPPGM